MRIGNFSVLIPEGREHGTGHVGLPHGAVYQLRLGNHSHLPCDAQVAIDGKDMGTYRVYGHADVTLQRAWNDPGRFTFFKADSAEGQVAQAGAVARDDQGLVRVTFRPAKAPAVPHGAVRRVGHMRAASWNSAGPGGQSVGLCSVAPEEKTSGGWTSAPKKVEAGVTGLTGHSDQQFTTVPDLDYDPLGVVEISLRLVCEGEGVAAVRPLTRVPATSNPVPPPV